MIELSYYCPECHTHLVGWYKPEYEIEQPDECLFCGGEQAFVYISDLEIDANADASLVEDILLRSEQAFAQEREIQDMIWEDPAYFDN